MTNGKRTFEILSWDYTEKGFAAYYVKGAGCKFSWLCEEADKELYPVEQTSAWSEEDETYLDHIITAVKLYYTDDKGKENPWRNELLRWFESLKDRVLPQPKQEWSEEDEEMLNQVIEDIVKLAGPRVCYHKDVDWLKSIKDRYTWKPCDEQITVLHDVAAYIDNSIYPNQKDILVNLYLQLKKLREE